MNQTKLTKSQMMEQELKMAGMEIEDLMEDFPCLREICHGLKPAAYPAALFVGAAYLGTLMTRCHYHFYHRPHQERRLNYCVYIIGHPGTGKSFAERLFEVIAEPIVRETKASTRAWNNYKRRLKRWEDGGKKGQGPDKPRLLIRTHPARTANHVFIQNMMNAIDTVDGKEMHLHMLSFDTELDNVTTQQRDHWKDKTFMEIKAFHNESDGEFYMNLDAPVGEFDVYWNYVYTGTPMALKKKVDITNIGGGFATRLAAIPMPSSHYEMIPLEQYHPTTAKDSLSSEEQTLREWAERLDKAHGELPIKKLVKYTWEWTKERMEEAGKYRSEADEIMCKRVAYYGINVSMPFILMRHWYEWQERGTLTIDETDERLCQLVMDIQYLCQDYFFGDLWDEYFRKIHAFDIPPTKRHTDLSKKRYHRLPEKFDVYTVQDLCDVEKRNAEKMIERWLSDHYIERIETGYYRKIFMELT